eukprot:767447-Hanusia_phi.AAC.4
MAEEWVQAEKTWQAELDAAKLDYQRLIKSEDEHANILKLMIHMPRKVEHEVMVPVGPMAFMPGKLVHTNEVLVLLGENYFVKSSAYEAREILNRRSAAIAKLRAEAQSKVENLAIKASFSRKAVKDMILDLSASQKRENQIQLNTDSKPISDDDIDECEDEGQGAEFWRDKGFVGCFNYDDEDEEDGEEEKIDPEASQQTQDSSPWNDHEPVVEIVEPLEGGEPHVVKYASQKDFEDRNNFTLPPELMAIFDRRDYE